MTMHARFKEPYRLVEATIFLTANDTGIASNMRTALARQELEVQCRIEQARHHESCTCPLCWAVAVLDDEKSSKKC